MPGRKPICVNARCPFNISYVAQQWCILSGINRDLPRVNTKLKTEYTCFLRTTPCRILSHGSKSLSKLLRLDGGESFTTQIPKLLATARQQRVCRVSSIGNLGSVPELYTSIFGWGLGTWGLRLSGLEFGALGAPIRFVERVLAIPSYQVLVQTLSNSWSLWGPWSCGTK